MQSFGQQTQQQLDLEVVRDRILSSWRVVKRSESKERIREALDRFIAELSAEGAIRCRTF